MNNTPHVNDQGQCARARQELGVYVLGAIAPAQRAQADRHLAACPRCRAELAGLAGLPALLRKVPADEAHQLLPGNTGPAGPPLRGLLSQVVRARRLRRWRLAAVAAVITAAAAGVLALDAVPPPAGQPPGRTITVAAADPATRVRAVVRYTAEPWGTELEVQVTGVTAGTRCQLWVTGPGRQQAVAGGWTVPSGQQAAWVPASASLPAASVHAFEITTGLKILVSVAARP
jgi:hypothetical protein